MSEREIRGRVLSIRLDGAIQTSIIGETVRDIASKITYDVILFAENEQNAISDEPPGRRNYSNIRIISAAPGDPCTLVISDDLSGTIVRRLFVHEDIDYYDCDMNPILPL
ncbi:MAG: hypothetical protein JKY67_00110 [Pseudomonadales bacterium]|nr:hypothetical protein [Pseudomonadales bacterium]